ncbi:MAG: sugar phosphate isomerase/epimerase [Leadbetterella sp.]|nr:sugar phosphate isomerase/epimerase [Leadbetterella sp.]
MYLSRRKFLKTTGMSALAAPVLLNSLSSCSTGEKDTKPFGIQLWTVKEDMAKDPLAVLNLLSDYGYRQIESFTGDKGPFWGMPAKEFQKVLGDLGMKMVSSHVDPRFTIDPASEDDYKKLCDDCASIGVQHLFNPYPGPQGSSDDWKRLAEGLNRQGALSKAAGVKSGYHNHHQEFTVTPQGDLPYSILTGNTDPALVDFELDLYWAVKAGQDPQKWFRETSGRISFAHFKDLYPEEKVKELDASDEPRTEEWPVGASTFLGNGRIDFAAILKTGKEHGLQYCIVEQERFDGSTALDDSRKDAEYMKKLLAGS